MSPPSAGAGEELVGRLRRAAVLLADQLDHRRSVAADATAAWEGRFRREFDDELDRVLATLASLVHACDVARFEVLAELDRHPGPLLRADRSP